MTISIRSVILRDEVPNGSTPWNLRFYENQKHHIVKLAVFTENTG